MIYKCTNILNDNTYIYKHINYSTMKDNRDFNNTYVLLYHFILDFVGINIYLTHVKRMIQLCSIPKH